MTSKEFIQQNTDIFKCPICGSEMGIFEHKSLLCKNKHCFDLSKHGYVNFLLSPVKTEYDKEMLKARNRILKNGFFIPIAEKISNIIQKEVTNKNSIILDAGCGEGTFLKQVFDMDALNHAVGVGLDLSKEGIQLASREYKNHIWCVGDLAKTPFQSNTFDIVLNILSPSNYSEFNRILSDDGMLIKVVPETNYLKELRDAFYDKIKRQAYSNEEVIEHFNQNFSLTDKQQISYTVALDSESLAHLIKMTPLSWNAPKDKIQEVLLEGIDNITVDLTILYGKKSR